MSITLPNNGDATIVALTLMPIATCSRFLAVCEWHFTVPCSGLAADHLLTTLKVMLDGYAVE